MLITCYCVTNGLISGLGIAATQQSIYFVLVPGKGFNPSCSKSGRVCIEGRLSGPHCSKAALQHMWHSPMEQAIKTRVLMLAALAMSMPHECRASVTWSSQVR